MKPSITLAALIVLLLLGSGGKTTAAKEVAIDDSAADAVEGFFDPCELEVVTCPFETIEYKIRKAAKGAGIDEETAVRIATAESSLRCKSVNYNSNGSNDMGLFQINSIHGVPDECRLDCGCNIKWAIEIMKRRGFQPWYSSKNKWHES